MGRIVDRQWLERVKSLPCAVCGSPGPSDAHHVRYDANGRHYGMGQRAGDHETIPLCRAHHQTGPDAYHAGPRSWIARYGSERDMLDWVLDTLGEPT